MKLRTTPPPSVADLLRRAGAEPEELVLSVSTDINLLGEYAPQWVLADRKTLWVADGPPEGSLVVTPNGTAPVTLKGNGKPGDGQSPSREQEAPSPQPSPSEGRGGSGPAFTLPLSEASEFRTISVVGSGLLQAKTGEMWLDICRYSNRLKYPFGRLAKRLTQLAEGQTFTLEDVDEHDPCRCPKCALMLEFPGETCPRCINRGAAMRRVLELMRPYWRQAAAMMALLLTGITLMLCEPLLTKYMIDHVVTLPGTHALGPVPVWGKMVEATKLLLMLVGVVALGQACRVGIAILKGRLGSRVATAITYDVRGRLVEHLEKLGLSYYDKQQIGSLVGRVAYDTEAVQGFVNQLTEGFLMQLIMVVCSAIMMFTLAPRLAMWALLPAPFVFSGTFIFYRFVYPHYRRFWDRSSRQAGMLNGLLSGIRVVRAFAQEDRELLRFDKSSAALRDARRMVDVSAATFYPTMFLVFQMGGWIVWYVGGREVLRNSDNPGAGITLGTLMAFFGLMWMFYNPLNALTNLTTWLTQFTTQMHRIFEVLDTPVDIRDVPNPVRLPAVRGEIEYRNVIFGYSRQSPILKNVSLKIQPGQKIGVVGKSGSGKTTIVNLLLRFYDVDEGQILIDGVELTQIAKQDLRRQIGVVLQEPFLFRGTIWENLIYGQTGAPVEQVLACCKAGNCHDFILRQMHAYDTWVGERGAGLSGGERQRLSIARALLCEPRILILDEATSSVDSESEMLIQQALAELTRGRTSLIIAHRLSTLRHCDAIMVVDEGRLVEWGSHTELMEKNGRYARLVRIQSNVSKQQSVDDLAVREKVDGPDKPGEAGKGAEAEKGVLPVDPQTGLTPITGHRLRYLTPEIANIHLGNHGALHVTVLNERAYTGVFAVRCMPVRFPGQYISLRWINAENNEQEIGLVRNLTDWPEGVRRLLHEALLRRYFVHTITGVRSIRQFQNYLDFDVLTDMGPREFIMRYSSHSAYDYGVRGKMIVDVEENRYVIPDVPSLPPPDRQLFERYIYW